MEPNVRRIKSILLVCIEVFSFILHNIIHFKTLKLATNLNS